MCWKFGTGKKKFVIKKKKKKERGKERERNGKVEFTLSPPPSTRNSGVVSKSQRLLQTFFLVINSAFLNFYSFFLSFHFPSLFFLTFFSFSLQLKQTHFPDKI
ncbi:hypothetical protein KIL84_002590 [Mauremys mutica]|uniref:Transmembrane protein n=1 Tax=Mauremys mutica TaxID=74926 RepID=A0A9D3X7Q0_9SAUR|nr:hypothetical protein KIL84_002590 [Mauremys mutica]